MIKVKLEWGTYEVIDIESNMEMFNKKEFDSFFVKCSPEESNCGWPMALVDKEDVIEVIEDDI